MVISGKKSGFGDKDTKAGGKMPRKVPFLDLYLVPGAMIRRRQESRKIMARMMGKLLAENRSLSKRLARYED